MEMWKLSVCLFCLSALLGGGQATSIAPRSDDEKQENADSISTGDSAKQLPVMTTTADPGPILAGMKSRFTQKAFDDVSTTSLDLLTSYLTPGREFPEFEQNVENLGEVKFSNLKLEEFPRPEMVTTMSPEDGVKFELSGVSPVLTGNYSITINMFFYMATHTGIFRAAADNAFATFGLHADDWTTATPVLNISNCDLGGDIETNFEGDSSEMLEFAAKIQIPTLMQVAKSRMCNIIEDFLSGKLLEITRKMEIPHFILPTLAVEYGHAVPPMFLDDAIESYHKGIFSYVSPKDDWVVAPQSMPELPVIDDHDDQHIYLYLSEYSVNTLFFAATESGFFDQRITEDTVPPERLGYLATTCTAGCVGAYFPQLARDFPNRNVAVRMSPDGAPEMRFANDSITLTIAMTIGLSVPDDGKFVTYLTQEITGSVTASGELRNNRAHFIVKDVSFKSKGESEYLDELELESLAKLRFGQKMLVQNINDMGRSGIPLPDLIGLEINSKLHTDPRIPNVVILSTNFDLLHKEIASLFDFFQK